MLKLMIYDNTSLTVEMQPTPSPTPRPTPSPTEHPTSTPTDSPTPKVSEISLLCVYQCLPFILQVHTEKISFMCYVACLPLLKRIAM